DCTAKLIKKLYDPKFSSARTKSEAIICNVLCPLSEEEVQHDLDKCSFVTLTVEASNHKDIKLFPVLVRYFKPLEGVKVKIIEFSSLPGETSDLQTAYISHVIEKHGLAQKIVALCADNTNTNFGGVKRAGKGNIWRKLQIQLGRDILGIGCNAHIIHNTLQTAVDCLPIDLECFAVKVYKYFHIYTVRVKELKEFCDFVQLDYQKLLQHGSTRFLSLGPSLERILHLFDGLRAYFLSQEKCPKFLKDTFSNPCTKLWLGFALKQTAAFHRALKTVEQDNISATEVALHIYDLRNVLQARLEESFIPSDIKTLLDTLVEAGDIKADDFYCAVRSFYSASVDYLDNWSCSLENTKEIEWVLLRSFPEWRDIQSSLSNFYSKIPALTSVDKTMLFDEWACAKNIVTCHITEWNKNKVAVSDRWTDVFSEMGSKSLNFGVLSLAVEFVLCLPGTSAPVERVFSLMNASWTDEKSRQSVTTMKAMLFVRINFGLDCSAFYDKLLKDKRTLAKIGSSEKYKTATVNDAVAPSCSH
uniref:HAT C-terminal dimerisation domain-containing protein n=1 Tax=Cyprinus carpio TaxID=7962 RepID=A0A8C2HNR2_CYPCA